MIRICGISGSVRQGSYNSALLAAAKNLMPAGAEIAEASIKDIPLYNGDVEKEHGIPDSVKILKEQIANADGLLLVTPEYNNSIPGVFKNAIDWASRPAKEIPQIFGGKPVGLIGASDGRGGTRFAQTAWLPIFKTLGMKPFFGRIIYVANADEVFDEKGQLIDDKIKTVLQKFMTDFVSFCQ